MPGDDDRIIVEGLKRGDADSAAKLYEMYKTPLYSYLVSVIRDGTSAEDLLQEVFLKALRSIRKYHHRGRLKQWLFEIAYHAAIDHIRKSKRTVRTTGIHNDDEWTVSLPDDSEGPEEKLMSRELSLEVQRAIERLSPEQRTVIHLRTKEEMSFREIAEAMGTSVNTALGRMHYAVCTLRKQLKQFAAENVK